jgi:hypothetical protein
MNGKRMTPVFGAMLLAAVLFGLGFAPGPGQSDKHPEVDFSVSCVECHRDATPEIVSQWKSSKHGLMNFACYMCHGDGKQEFSRRPGTERCQACHSALNVDFSRTPAKNCFDCHNGHTLKFHQ